MKTCPNISLMTLSGSVKTESRRLAKLPFSQYYVMTEIAPSGTLNKYPCSYKNSGIELKCCCHIYSHNLRAIL